MTWASEWSAYRGQNFECIALDTFTLSLTR